MKKIILFLLILFTVSNPASAKDLTLTNAPTQVYFSPNGGCTEAIVESLGKAKTEVLVQAYSFTSKTIAKALVDAHKRGVHVEIILDKSNKNKNGKYSAADFTAHAGIPTFIDSSHQIAHNKIMILDRETVITGSFNFTKAAENSNAENLLIIKSKELAKDYIENWERHKGHSEVYGGK
jgi:phosphatidylserine/phosphatidylglycerophosphate/cardiolipin synthase-like enzyme